MEFENKEICKNCGGKCCIKSGCDYFVDDLPAVNKQYVTALLDTGNVSIVAALMFGKLRNGKEYVSPFLYLRARNVDRDIVDLFSMKTSCMMLTPTGCTYSLENRPSGGVNLIPMENGGCRPNVDPISEIKKWEPYQNLLAKMVRKYSKMSVDQKLSKDVEDTFVSILNEDFEGVAEAELLDIFSCVNDLVPIFHDEYENAKKRTGKSTVYIR